MRLTESQLRTFREDGVLIAPHILTHDDFAPVQDELEQWIDARAHDLLTQGKITNLHAAAPFDQRIALLFDQCPDIVQGIDIMHLRGRAMFAFLHNQNLLDVVEQLIGPEITCNPIQHLRPKMPSSVGNGKHELVPWHQDAGVTMEDADSSDIVTCWMPMCDATREVGCMEVLPGASKLGHLEHVSLGGSTIRPDLLPNITPLCAECPRGGAVFMTKYTPHRGLPNQSTRVRWTIDLRFQKTGTPTGRPQHPDFPVRSKAQPESVTRDYDLWRRRWADGLERGKGVQMHRVVEMKTM